MTTCRQRLASLQLERLSEFVSRKRAMGRRYTELLADVPGLQLPPARSAYAESIYWVYGVVLEDEVPFRRCRAMRKLAGPEDRNQAVFFGPCYEQPVLARNGLFAGERYPIAERLQGGVSIFRAAWP